MQKVMTVADDFYERNKNDMTPKVIWHYTVKAWLDGILTDKMIRFAHAGWNQGERLAVWFSANPIWEPTASKFIKTDGTDATLQEHWQATQGIRAEVHDERKGEVRMEYIVAPEFQPARIGVAVATAPFRWFDFKRMSGVSAKVAKLLYQRALAVGSRPGEWYISFEPVPEEKWLSVQLYDGKGWVDK